MSRSESRSRSVSADGPHPDAVRDRRSAARRQAAHRDASGFRERVHRAVASRCSCEDNSVSRHHRAIGPLGRTLRTGAAADRSDRRSLREARADPRLSRPCLRRASFQPARHPRQAASTAGSDNSGSRNARLLLRTARRARVRPVPRPDRERRRRDNPVPDGARPRQISTSPNRAGAARCSTAPSLQPVRQGSRCRDPARESGRCAGSCRPC